MGNTINHIIKNCKRQDRRAQKELYKLTYEHLAVAVALYTKNYADRDWVFNLGMHKVFNSLDNYKEGSNYFAWSRIILVRSAIDYHRKILKHTSMVVPVDYQSDFPSDNVLNEGMQLLETEDIISAIQSLPDRERLTFTLREIEGYKYHEISDKTGINTNTLKWLLSKAKKKLMKKINTLHQYNRSVYEK